MEPKRAQSWWMAPIKLPYLNTSNRSNKPQWSRSADATAAAAAAAAAAADLLSAQTGRSSVERIQEQQQQYPAITRNNRL